MITRPAFDNSSPSIEQAKPEAASPRALEGQAAKETEDAKGKDRSNISARQHALPNLVRDSGTQDYAAAESQTNTDGDKVNEAQIIDPIASQALSGTQQEAGQGAEGTQHATGLSHAEVKGHSTKMQTCSQLPLQCIHPSLNLCKNWSCKDCSMSLWSLS